MDIDGLAATAGRYVELIQKIGKIDVVHQLVNDDSHGPVGGMGTQVDYRSDEPRVFHLGHRDQELPGQVTLSAVIRTHVHALPAHSLSVLRPDGTNDTLGL